MPKKKKVVLFFPSYVSNEACPPLALIAIAGPLISEGYEVKIVDTALEEDYLNAVMCEMDDALCLGMSLITGPMIAGAVEVGKAVKQNYPDVPIVLGGWHPSILPRQTLEADFVDVVALKQGEMTLMELVKCFENGGAVEDVSGILWKDEGEIRWNPPRKYPKVGELPSRIPGYDLIDYERYYQLTGLRWLMYTTSHGCPYNCGYCSNASVYGRNLDVLPVEQVVDEVTYLVKKYNIKLMGIIDDIYFAFRDRCLEMAEGFIRSGLDFEWYIQDRVDSWARLTTEQAKLYRRAGLVRIHYGAESGSDDVLQSIEKKADVEKTIAAVRRCKEANIRASFGFIFGLPAEEEEDINDTLDLINRIYMSYHKADCYTNIFTPYPGSPLWPVSIEKGLDPPKSFEEWANFYPRITELPWLSGDKYRHLQAIRQYLRFGYHQVKVGEKNHSWKHLLLLNLLRPTARYRIRTKKFRFPLEIYGYWGFQKLKRGFDLYERY
ncbi:radical SAM protein [candidate division KSB1 bacterium]|nr:radical SAM protein [candidate division KSB1 bacterium]NIR70958.1 radical SAM protein [candidate division KSB1 bacterium]NIS24694.1 radical SAM protein [candidate division KSB1 bacterium]NIT71603.1 radical SAM protein [candidate division KSB1 bacterium]NIU25307.1 radical SAM protein [candidate division KSB1 bacterium]